MTYEEILAYLESLKGAPVDLQAAMQGNPNEVNPVARGGTDVAWGNVPGLEQFYSYDQANNQGNFNLSAALPEIQRLGYQVMQAEDPGAETMASWVDDGCVRHVAVEGFRIERIQACRGGGQCGRRRADDGIGRRIQDESLLYGRQYQCAGRLGVRLYRQVTPLLPASL